MTTILMPPTETTRSPVNNRLLSGEELYSLGNIGPAELVRGEIKKDMPTGYIHGFIENIIGSLLFIYLQAHDIGRAFTGEVGIYTARNPDTVRAADVIFISHERYAQVQAPGYLDVAPELVVEILSPTDRWSEIQEKLAEYFSAGVEVIWLVDPQLAQVHVYQGLESVTLLTKTDELSGGELLPGLNIPLSKIFTT